jgi:diphthamide biosynthesis protein 4
MTESSVHLDHYQVLNLPSRSTASQNDIKLAYRRALLRHHPDKCGKQSSNTNTQPLYTLDQVFLAYRTLVNPTDRFEYDRKMKTSNSAGSHNGTEGHPGLETSDLDDLAYDSDRLTWSKSCRCGNQKGFVINEKDLEDNAEYGELLTGCGGCSLWLRVTFAVLEDE